MSTTREKAIKLFEEIFPASNPNSSFARERKMTAIFAIEEALAREGLFYRAIIDAQKKHLDFCIQNHHGIEKA